MGTGNKILDLSEEVQRLQKSLLFKERRIRELEREVNDYVLRERHLMEEIEELTQVESQGGRQKLHFAPQTDSVEEYINPKLPTTSSTQNNPLKGLEEEWEDFMYAYTDFIFVGADRPDLLLYRDDRERCYKSPTGRTELRFPIAQEDLIEFNIVKVRPLTEEELEQICEKFKL